MHRDDEVRTIEPTPDPPSTPGAAPESSSVARRGFLESASTVAMFGGLVASYGTFAAMAGRFLYPLKPRDRSWLYVTEVSRLKPGESLVYVAPTGEKIAIARRSGTGKVEDFLALSSVCPHLGCQVHWQGAQNRFFCPCHNGVFDPTGKAMEGPPAEAGQSLPNFPLKIEGSLLYILVPITRLASAAPGADAGRIEAPGGPDGPGKDPCLYGRGGIEV